MARGLIVDSCSWVENFETLSSDLVLRKRIICALSCKVFKIKSRVTSTICGIGLTGWRTSSFWCNLSCMSWMWSITIRRWQRCRGAPSRWPSSSSGSDSWRTSALSELSAPSSSFALTWSKTSPAGSSYTFYSTFPTVSQSYIWINWSL